MNNGCYIVLTKSNHNYQGHTIGSSGGGFALIISRSDLQLEKGEEIKVVVSTFSHIDANNVLSGEIIRINKKADSIMIGCYTPMENKAIIDYVEKNKMD